MRSPDNAVITKLPQLITVPVIAGPDLKLVAISVTTIWHIEALVSVDADLGDWAWISRAFSATSLDYRPFHLWPVKATTITKDYGSSVIIPLNLEARGKTRCER